MMLKYKLLLLSCILAFTAYGQKNNLYSLNIGDAAPSIHVQKWIKGTPINYFEKGQVYVVDFWATWCRPCNAAMPHLSALSGEYTGKITILVIDIWENKPVSHASMKEIENFVDSMGKQMNFPVAIDDSNFMAHHWVEASGENSIPSDFVVNSNGNIAWIGNPVDLDKILPQVIQNTWDINKARAKRNFNQYLRKLDLSVGDKVRKYLGTGGLVKPDSTLLIINKMVKKEPKLKYAPITALFTFWALLKTNEYKAYEYGKGVIETSTYQGPAYYYIIGKIKDFSHRLKNPKAMYRLGAEAYQAKIDNTHPVYRILMDTSKIYHKMAAWYLLAGDTARAMAAKLKSFNTTITIQNNHLKKDATPLGFVLYGTYSLKSPKVLQPINIKYGKGITRIFKMYLDHPVILSNGKGKPSFWLIKPGDSLLLKKSSISHLGTSSLVNQFTIQNKSGLMLPNIQDYECLVKHIPSLSNKEYFETQSDSLPIAWLDKMPGINEFNENAKLITEEYLKNNPNYTNSQYNIHYLKNWFAQMLFFHKAKLAYTSSQDTSLQNRYILQLAAKFSKKNEIKTLNYWKAIQNITANILVETAKKNNFNIDSLMNQLEPFDDTTQQYILLYMLRNNSSSLQNDNLAWTAMTKKINLPVFKPYLEKYQKRDQQIEGNSRNNGSSK